MAFLIVYRDELEVHRVELSGPVTVGRMAAECDLVSRDPKISRRHCRIEPVSEGWRITDLHSSNGTYIDGERVQSRILRDGDMIALGDTLLRFGEGALPRRRPAGPEQALQLARAGRSTADLEADPLRELAPRPIPRAWDSPGGTGLSDTSTGMNVPAPSPD